jgi:hypothetical protein
MFKRDILSAQRAMRGFANFSAELTWEDYERLDRRLADARSELKAKAVKFQANEEKLFLTMEFTNQEIEMMEEGLIEMRGKEVLDAYDEIFLKNLTKLSS